MKDIKLAALLLRVGLGFVFLYAAYSATATPENWIGYFPKFLQTILPGNLILNLFSIYELILGIWLLTGWKIFYPSILASLSMLGIIIFNFAIFDVVFRDVAIFFMGLALSALSKSKD